MEHGTDSGDCRPEGKAGARRTSRRGESAIAEAVAGAGRLIDAHPEAMDWIREDRLALGRLRRLQEEGRTDAEIAAAMSSPDLPPEAQTLGAGRPPLPPEAVLPAIVPRGLPGSVTATPPRAVTVESASVRAFPDRCGAGLPGRTTLPENLNAVSAGHLQRIVGLVCRDQESRRPGSFGTLTVDSTPVRADMAPVTDTHLVWSSADRLCGLLGRAAADGLLAPALPAEARGWLDGLARGARTVALSGGPARRHRETVRGMLGDACRLALAAWEPVRGLAARRDGWRTEGPGRPAAAPRAGRRTPWSGRSWGWCCASGRRGRAGLRRWSRARERSSWGPPTRTRRSS